MKNSNNRAAFGRSEFIEVEKNVRLHVSDLGEGSSVILIHGWPLSDAMYEYQYAALIKNGYRAIGITLRGFGQSDKPYGKYDYDVFAADIKVILEELQIDNAVLCGFSFGGATLSALVQNTIMNTSVNWPSLEQLHLVKFAKKIFLMGFQLKF